MKVKSIFILVLIFILALTGCTAPEKAPEKAPENAIENSPQKTQEEKIPEETPQEDIPMTYKQISMDEAIKIMEMEKDYIILDVRTEDEFNEKHIPGAVCIPNETIGEDEIPELPDKDQLILVYCRSGNRSKQASQKLFDLGYTNIHEFGGINDWPGETVSE